MGTFVSKSNPTVRRLVAHLVAMSLDDFRGLPQRVVPRTVRMRDSSLTSQDAIDWIFIGYCEKLIQKNEPLADLLL